MQRLLQRAAVYGRAAFAIDVRALAALRIGLALVVLGDLLSRAPDTAAMLSDAGLISRAEAAASAQVWRHSPFFWSGSAWAQGAWMAVTAAAAVAMLLGARTRLSTAVVWVLVCSLQMRNPHVLAGGDLVLRCCLFWSIFLPAGAAFSLDGRGKKPPRTASGLPAFAFLVQVAIIYLASGYLKTGIAWRDGSAVWQVLQLRQFRTAFGAWLGSFPRLSPVLTWAVLWLEKTGPLLAFAPAAAAVPFSVRAVRKIASASRLVVAAAFIAFHLSLAATLQLGMFPWVCCVALLPLLPSPVWRRLPLRARAARVPAPLLYDVALLSLVFYLLAWNLSALPLPGPSDWLRARLSRGETWFMTASSLEQNWSMFAPNPLAETQLLMAEGETREGERMAVDAGKGFAGRASAGGSIFPTSPARTLLPGVRAMPPGCSYAGTRSTRRRSCAAWRSCCCGKGSARAVEWRRSSRSWPAPPERAFPQSCLPRRLG